MCQTEIISQSITRLSKRTFARRLDVLSSQVIEHKGTLTRLNNELDDLYDLLYDSYAEMTETEYHTLSPYLSILISTLKDLYTAYKHTDNYKTVVENVERLRMNIIAIEEIEHDIRYFKIALPKNPRYNEIVSKTKCLSPGK